MTAAARAGCRECHRRCWNTPRTGIRMAGTCEPRRPQSARYGTESLVWVELEARQGRDSTADVTLRGFGSGLRSGSRGTDSAVNARSKATRQRRRRCKLGQRYAGGSRGGAANRPSGRDRRGKGDRPPASSIGARRRGDRRGGAPRQPLCITKGMLAWPHKSGSSQPGGSPRKRSRTPLGRCHRAVEGKLYGLLVAG